MRATPWSVAVTTFVLLLCACSNSTAPVSCNIPTATTSPVLFTGSYSGVVQRRKIEPPQGNTPGGPKPYSQLDLSVLILDGITTQNTTVQIIVDASTPVLESINGADAAPTSACDIRVGDRIALWAPIGFGDFPPSDTSAAVAQKLIIQRGD